jgi:hypothetical protein
MDTLAHPIGEDVQEVLRVVDKISLFCTGYTSRKMAF